MKGQRKAKPQFEHSFMREFEKWWKRGKYDVNKVPYADDKTFAKIMWKIALEWVLSLDPQHEQTVKIDGIDVYDVRSSFALVKEIIKEELGE